MRSSIVLDSRRSPRRTHDCCSSTLGARPREVSAGADGARSVSAWIEKLSEYPDEDLFDAEGRKLERRTSMHLMHNIALESVPASQPTRYGLVVQRADLRTFPTPLRVFNSAGRPRHRPLPGKRAVPRHAGRDRAREPRRRTGGSSSVALYAAWIEKRYVAEGAARRRCSPTRARRRTCVVTGATVRTVFTPEQPDVSELQLDMGVRVPLLADWPPASPVNGQHPYTAHVIELPVRAARRHAALHAGAAAAEPPTLASDYLPLTRANLLRQGFKFLGERYGWGHSYNARDCSGFVSEVYRSFGVQLPRNTRDQAVSPALQPHRLHGGRRPASARLAVLRDAARSATSSTSRAT